MLLEQRPLTEIEDFFTQLGFRLGVHNTPPPQPSAEEARRLLATVRKSMRTVSDLTCWVDLDRVDGGESVRWYGSGMNHEEAIRRAAARWRAEQGMSAV
jgi:hypothetical protein